MIARRQKTTPQTERAQACVIKKDMLSHVFFIIRHRATFPHRSIIAAAGLNFGVRDGNRCIPCAKSTGLAALRLVTPMA